MFRKLVPISKKLHVGFNFNPPEGFSFISDTHIVALMAPEYPRAASEFPIVFVESESGGFKSVAMLGVRPSENLLIDEQGRWLKGYIPAVIRRYPFALAQGASESEFAVCIDEGGSVLSKDQGEALFDENGEPSKLLENVKEYLLDLRKMELQTDAFCQFLQQNNLLTPLNIKLKEGGSVKAISGLFAINNERLDKVSDEVILECRKRGYLPLIYAHLGSLSQIQSLLKLRSEVSSPSLDNAH